MLRITLSLDPVAVEKAIAEGRATGLSVTIADEHAPALRSALDELRTILGGRLEDAHLYVREDALTRASIAIGTLASAVNQIVPKEDPNYNVRAN